MREWIALASLGLFIRTMWNLMKKTIKEHDDELARMERADRAKAVVEIQERYEQKISTVSRNWTPDELREAKVRDESGPSSL